MKLCFAIITAALLQLQAGAAVFVIINNDTPGYYNEAIGALLNDTSPVFPSPGDPNLDITNAPDLGAAQAVLGNWLVPAPELPPGSWTTSPVPVPRQWKVGTVSGILYCFEAPPGGYTNFLMKFAVDNGICVWLDGQFVGGATRFGGADMWEHQYSLRAIAGGVHYLQILRADRGVVSDYQVEITGEAGALPVQAEVKTAAEISWPSQKGAFYQVQVASEADSTSWTNLGAPFSGTGDRMSAFDSLQGGARKFYRIVVLQ